VDDAVQRLARCGKDLDVPALKFDTLDYGKQLTSAGVEAQVAEIHAMTMKQAFGMLTLTDEQTIFSA
jgi:hypothetical protein